MLLYFNQYYSAMNIKITPLEVKIKNGNIVCIRQAIEDDTEKLIEFGYEVVTTSDTMLQYPEEYDLEYRRANNGPLRDHLSKSAEMPNRISLVAVHNDAIIGSIGVNGSRLKKMERTASISIEILQEWRGIGLGYALMETAVKWARNSLLEVLWLEVLSSNTAGIALYKKVGFIECGRIKDFFIQPSGEYNDSVTMSLHLK